VSDYGLSCLWQDANPLPLHLGCVPRVIAGFTEGALTHAIRPHASLESQYTIVL